MRRWEHDIAYYATQLRQDQPEMEVWVKGALADGERPKLVLEEHHENKGPKLSNEDARSKLIQDLAATWEKQPEEIDWYMLDQKGELTSLDPQRVNVTREHPTFADIKEDMGSHRDQVEEAHKKFPDITEEKALSPQKPLTPAQEQEVNEAFPGGWARESSNPREATQDMERPGGLEYDLAQEQITARSEIGRELDASGGHEDGHEHERM